MMEVETSKSIKEAICNNDLELLKNLLDQKSPELYNQVLYFAVENIDMILNDKSLNGNQREEAVRAAEKNNKKLVKFILNHGADINVIIKDYLGHRIDLTCYTYYTCDFTSAESLLKALIETNASQKRTLELIPIQIAFESGQEDLINLFLERGFDGDEINRLHLLNHYVQSKTPEESIVMRLLQLGADINGINGEGLTVLQSAIIGGNLECLKYLVQKGADIHGSGKWDSQLRFAVFYGHIETIKILLEHGAEVTDAYVMVNSLLNPREDRLEVTELLLNYGADINAVDDNGLTPIVHAVTSKDERLVKMLLDQGARRNNDALYEAMWELVPVKIVKLLLDRGYDPNCVIYNKTALSNAILPFNSTRERIGYIELLLDYGAQVNGVIPDDNMKPALHYAVEDHKKEVVKLLLDRRADINAEHNGMTALRMLLVQQMQIYLSNAVRVEKRRYELSKFLVWRMVLMRSQDLFISEANFDAINSDERLKAYQKQCNDELELLKAKRFEESFLSYFDILEVKDVGKLAGLARNESILKVLKSTDFKDEFPIYGEMIVKHFEQGVLKHKDFALVKRFIDYLSIRNHDKLPKLPFTFVCELFSYLNDADIATLRNL